MGHCAIEGGKTYCPQKRKEKKKTSEITASTLLYFINDEQARFQHQSELCPKIPTSTMLPSSFKNIGSTMMSSSSSSKHIGAR